MTESRYCLETVIAEFVDENPPDPGNHPGGPESQDPAPLAPTPFPFFCSVVVESKNGSRCPK